jgi:hypothetical protein
MTDFEAMDKMAAADMDITACADITESKVARGGGKVTIGVPKEIHYIIANQLISGNTTHYVALYIINKEQFDKIKNQK